tara:strand:+ start:47407 stop:48525 length:1119 start_codon:yes stop_codon:yes gene_type:complete
MKTPIYLICFISLFIASCSNNDDTSFDQGNIISYSPTEAFTGETVTIVFENIDVTATYEAFFNGIPSPLVEVSGNEIKAVIPYGDASGTLSITNSDNKTLEVGEINVFEEKGAIFFGKFLNPNSGLVEDTPIRFPVSDAAKLYIHEEHIPVAQGYNIYCHVRSIYYDGSGSGGGIPGNCLTRNFMTGDTDGFFYSHNYNNNQELDIVYKRDYLESPLRQMLVPQEYTLLDNFYFEDISLLGYIVEIQGQEGKHLWLIDMETSMTASITPLGTTVRSFGKSITEDLLAINEGATNQLVRIDKNSGEVTEILFDTIPDEFTSKRIMQSKSTGRYFLISPTKTFIINLDNDTSEIVDHTQNFSYFEGARFKFLNF